MQHVITEYAHGRPALRHLVSTTERKVSATAWNREIGSVNAFRRFSYGFIQFGRPEPARSFGVQFKEDYDRDQAILPYEEVPFVEHATVFDFYVAVGFDYKRKKFK